MKNIRLVNLIRVLLICVLVLSANTAPLAAAKSLESQAWPNQTGPDAPPFAITGRVTDQAGAPLQGVMVKASLNTGNVLVQDEAGNPVSGAEVFNETVLLGTTDAQGILPSPAIQAGNRLYARSRLLEKPTAKYNHNQNSSQNWAYRTYITSLDIPSAGEPQGQLITNPTLTQTLTLKKSNTLVGFNVVVSIEWDADLSFMEDIKLAFERASGYLYDVTDGQMLLEQVTIYDDNVNAGDVDMYFKTSNQVWPHTDFGRLTSASGRIDLGRYFNRNSASTGTWSSPDGYRTLIYLFSQYALGIYDSSYSYNAGQQRQNAVCTSSDIKTNPADPVNATLMYWRYNASEFSMLGVNGLWSTDCEYTLQYQKNALSDWEMIRSLFQDAQVPARWQIMTPQDRGGVVPGPQFIGLGAWSVVTLNNSATGVCDVPVVYQVQDESSTPVAGANVLLLKADGRGAIQQGETNSLGEIEILGTGNTDQVIINGWQGQLRSGSTSVSCTGLAPADPKVQPVLTIQPKGFDLLTAINPGLTAQDVSIVITATASVTTPLTLIFTQFGNPVSYSFSPTQDPQATVWTATASLSPIYERAGVVYIAATSNSNTVERIQDFDFQDINHSVDSVVHSNDGLAELTLLANSAPSSGKLLIETNDMTLLGLNSDEVLSGPFTIRVANGYQFPALANLAINFHDPGGLLQNFERRGMRIARWNGASWVAFESNQSSSTSQTISTVINQPGTYALVAKPVKVIFIPAMSRINAVSLLQANGYDQQLLQPLHLYDPQEITAVQGTIVYSMATDVNGYYTFTNIPAGSYLLSAVQPGFTFSPISRTIPPEGAAGQDFNRQAGTPSIGETIFIPSGSFQMGCNLSNNGGFACGNDAKPLHTVILSPYFISKYPVTTAQYAACVTGGGCTLPKNLVKYNNPLYTNHPVVHITWQQASTFCTWAGGSLPTEAQWEKAARGTTPRSYPWGEASPDCTLANYSGCVGNTNPVTKSTGVSPYGVMDMSGNVKEWVSDVYDSTYYANSPLYNPTGPTPVNGSIRSVRGGSYLDTIMSLLTGYRLGAGPDLWFWYVGFRCQAPTP